ncbi:MAG: DNA-binding protein [Anaerolineales bacterium]|nr:MAG: DNA-binding protein [Anaerolineales bacterium]
MKIYKTLKDAAEKYNVEPEKLQELVDQGDVRSGMLGDELIVLEDDVRTYVAERDVTREQFKHLEGVEIGVNQAAIKYRFNGVTIAEWVRKDKIRLIRQKGNRRMINEADVAYARALADIKGVRSGRPLFGRGRKERR